MSPNKLGIAPSDKSEKSDPYAAAAEVKLGSQRNSTPPDLLMSHVSPTINVNLNVKAINVIHTVNMHDQFYSKSGSADDQKSHGTVPADKPEKNNQASN